MPEFSYISMHKYNQDGNGDMLRSIWKGYDGHIDKTGYLQGYTRPWYLVVR